MPHNKSINYKQMQRSINREEEEMMESIWLVTSQLSERCCSEADGPPTVRPPATYSRWSDSVKEHEASGTDMLGRDFHVLAARS